jgi:hypothetical protein
MSIAQLERGVAGASMITKNASTAYLIMSALTLAIMIL